MSDSDEDPVNSFFDFSKPLKKITITAREVGNCSKQPEKPIQTSLRENLGTSYIDRVYKDEAEELNKTLSKLNITSITNKTASADYTPIESIANISNDSDEAFNETFAQLSLPQNIIHRKDLPIYKSRCEIIQKIRDNPVVVISGKTGCGKTTQVPQYIFDDCTVRNEHCNIIVTQPRRIAAMTIAQRVSNERNLRLGQLVGYQVKLHKKLTVASREDEQEELQDATTQILFCTTGVVLQKLIHEKNLNQYTHIILDEVHERDIDMDFLLIVVRRLLFRYSPMTKIILMSATMNTLSFANYFKFPTTDSEDFHLPPIIDLSGDKRTFAILEHFLEDLETFSVTKPTKQLLDYEKPGISSDMYKFASKVVYFCLRRYSEVANAQMMGKKKNLTPSTILVFLPGIYEIMAFKNELKAPLMMNTFKAMKLNPDICILHSSLSTEEQKLVFVPSTNPKIILATNIAESSITIPNVGYVIDFCLTKYQMSSKGQMSSLQLDWASQNNCMQRAGRTGRIALGLVYRLVHRKFFETIMAPYSKPEMRRIPLESVVIKTKILEMGTPLEILSLSLDPPEHEAVVDAVLMLKALGGLFTHNCNGEFDYEDGELTYLGRVMSILPVDARISKFITLGYIFGVLKEAVIIGAGLNLKSIFTMSHHRQLECYSQKLKWADGSGCDCIAVLNVYQLWTSYHRDGHFRDPSAEKNWCALNSIDMKNLYEMEELVKDIYIRLRALKIETLPSSSHLNWDDQEKSFILKICLAGALGMSNYFIMDENNMEQERDSYQSINNLDVFRTVCFHKMDRKLVGDIYQDQLKEQLVDFGVCNDINNISILFDYRSSERVFVTFENGNQLAEQDEQCNKEDISAGKAMPEVYRSVKLRQTGRKLEINVMDMEATMIYAVEQGLGTVLNDFFEINKNFIKRPELCVLPTTFMTVVYGNVTQIENCNKFFFRPSSAEEFNKGLTCKADNYKQCLLDIECLIKEISLSPITCARELSDEMFVIFKSNESYERANIVEPRKTVKTINNQTYVSIRLMDFGCTLRKIKMQNLFTIKNASDRKKVLQYPPRIFECTLQEVQPSFMSTHQKKWTREAVKCFTDGVLNQKASIEVYSIIDDVASVKLFTADNICWNTKLIEMGYGQDCEESYISKMEHERRLNRRITCRSHGPEIEFAQKIDKIALKNRKIKHPPFEKCINKISLIGPFSPLEMSLNGISRGSARKVIVQGNSVNSVIVNEEVLNFHTRLFVAAEVISSSKSNNVVLRETSMMPNIPGIGVLLGLIFSPAVELRRDATKSRYVSALFGLGFDKNLQQPYFGEHDCVLNIDVELSNDDIAMANHLRYSLSHLLFTKPSDDVPDILDGEKLITMKKIKEFILRILSKHRSPLEIRPPVEPFQWNVDQHDVAERSNPLGFRAIYKFIGLPPIYEIDEQTKQQLKTHCLELEACARNALTLYSKECKLCNITYKNVTELCLHLLSKLHINLKAKLFA